MRITFVKRCSLWAVASFLLGPMLGNAAERTPPVSEIQVAQAPSASSSPRKRPRTKAGEVETPAAQLEGVSADIGRLEGRLTKLQTDYGNPDEPVPADELKKQYEEATYLYLVEDYEKAALLFYTVLERAKRDTFANYDDAEYYLAESLSLGKNYFPALEYFTRIAEYGPAHRYYDPAVVNMVELYGKTGNFDKFSSYYASYIERNKGVVPTDTILYALGKTFFVQRDYPRALESFSKLTSSSGNYPHLSRYYIGTVHVALREYDKALVAFSELLKLSVNTPEQREVEDLTYLALGRIYYELGDFVRALANYQNISRDSSQFADALFEQSWTYVKKEDYEQAIRTIDILLLTFPDNVNVPRLKLVRGILQQRRQDYDEALDTFQKLVAEYTGIKEELDRIMREQKDILTYFNELIDSDLSRIESSFLVPALAVRFATAEKEMTQVLTVARDLKVEQRDLEESYRLLNDLESEVYGNPPKNLLVGMRRARTTMNSMQNTILLARERLLQSEQMYYVQSPDPQLQSSVAQLAARQEQQGRLARQIPDLQRDLAEMVEVYEDQVQEVQKNSFKLENLIEDLVAQSAAVEKYISYSRESGAMTLEMEQDARFKLRNESEQLTNDLNSLTLLQRELSELDVRRTIRDSQHEEEELFRTQADQRLTRTRKELQALRSQARGDAAFFSQMDAAHGRLDLLGQSILQFYAQLDVVEAQQVAKVKNDLEREKATLSECGTLATSYGEETGSLAEDIARRSFSKIQAHFSDLILSADFGITDVYWELKEEKANEIEQNQVQRADEIEALQEKFSGLQAGDL